LTEVADFYPSWASPPGDTIRDALDGRGLGIDDLGSALDVSARDAERLLSGDLSITVNLAARLANLLGATTEFWMARDGQYRDDLDRMELLAWLDRLPIDHLLERTQLSAATPQLDQAEEALRFFGADSYAEWQANYQALVAGAKYRIKDGAQPLESTAAWLRSGVLATKHIDCRRWDPSELAASLDELRQLTRVNSPTKFIPRLQRICARSGVAVGVVKAPPGLRISGSASFQEPDRALVLLSARHLSDDHFWFTFFHEIAHLLLHEPGALFLDEVGQDLAASDDEREADSFASQTLVPQDMIEELKGRRLNTRLLMRSSREAGVSAGVLVGQLQHLKVLRFNQHNKLKRRYKWNDTTLEIA